MNKAQSKIVIKLNLEKKQHDEIEFDITSGEYKNDKLANIIRESYNLYPRKFVFTLKQRYPNMDKKATKRALDERLLKIFYKHSIKNRISVNSLRSSFVSNKLSDRKVTYNDRQGIVKKMRTSMTCLERSYNKVQAYSPILKCKNKKCKNRCDDSECDDYFNEESNNDGDDGYNDSDRDDNQGHDDHDEHVEYDVNNENQGNDQNHENKRGDKKNNKKNIVKCIMKCLSPNVHDKKDKMNGIEDGCQNERDVNDDSNNSESMNENDHQNNDHGHVGPSQYQKKLQKNKEYYEKNKEKIKEKIKQNKERMTPFEKTRERLMQLLNASPDYAQRMKPATFAKYKFIYDNETKRWKWEDPDV
jgi:hypothetical protein